MFGWLFGKKNPKSLTKVLQETEVKGNRNRVVQTTNVVNQRGAKATGDLVGGNKMTWSPQPERYTSTTYDPMTDLLNPLNPLSPMSPLNQVVEDTPKHLSHSHDSGSSWSSSHSHSHSYDSGSSYHSHDHSSSSSYDSGSSYTSSSD